VAKLHCGSGCWQAESPVTLLGLEAIVRLLSYGKAGGLRQTEKEKKKAIKLVMHAKYYVMH